jgi:hypothetical protein
MYCLQKVPDGTVTPRGIYPCGWFQQTGPCETPCYPQDELRGGAGLPDDMYADRWSCPVAYNCEVDFTRQLVQTDPSGSTPPSPDPSQRCHGKKCDDCVPCAVDGECICIDGSCFAKASHTAISENMTTMCNIAGADLIATSAPHGEVYYTHFYRNDGSYSCPDGWGQTDKRIQYCHRGSCVDIDEPVPSFICSR